MVADDCAEDALFDAAVAELTAADAALSILSKLLLTTSAADVAAEAAAFAVSFVLSNCEVTA